MRTEFRTLSVSVSDGVAQVILNRPDVRNAISHEMTAELDLALDEAELDPDVGAVLLRGEGNVFSAGHDLKEQFSGRSFPALNFPIANPSIGPRLPRAWYFRKPLIGAVHRYVGPYAVAVVACCDFNIAATGTRFSCEVFRGHYPEMPWLPLYLQLPMRVIEKLFLMGGWMDADQALQFQFVQRVVPEDQLLEEALRWAKNAASIPSTSFARGKERIRRSIELLGLNSLHTALGPFEPPHEDPRGSNFGDVMGEKGVKEAVRRRDEGRDPELARI